MIPCRYRIAVRGIVSSGYAKRAAGPIEVFVKKSGTDFKSYLLVMLFFVLFLFLFNFFLFSCPFIFLISLCTNSFQMPYCYIYWYNQLKTKLYIFSVNIILVLMRNVSDLSTSFSSPSSYTSADQAESHGNR